MNSTDLKTQLLSLSTALDTGKNIFPQQLVQDIINVLNGLDDNTLNVLAALLRIPVDQLKTEIPSIIQLLTELNAFFTSGESTNVSSFCKKLSGRPFILTILSAVI